MMITFNLFERLKIENTLYFLDKSDCGSDIGEMIPTEESKTLVVSSILGEKYLSWFIWQQILRKLIY
jgi:hypothetical protein